MRRTVGALRFVHAFTRRSAGNHIFGAWPIQQITGRSGRFSFSSDARRTGVVGRWNEKRGFGFIKPDDGDKELFVHRSSIRQGMQLSSGQAVSFKVRWNEQKQQNHAISIDDRVAREDEGMWPSVDDGALDSEKCDPARSAQVREELELRTGSSRRVGIQTKPNDDAQEESEVEVKVKKVEEKLTSVSQSQQAWSTSASSFQQLEHMPIEPLKIPENASIDQRLDLLTGHVEQLRVQGQQMQQLLLQGMFAMVKQQAAQNANLERAVLALAENWGGKGGLTQVQGRVADADVIAPATKHNAAPSLSESRDDIRKSASDARGETRNPDVPREKPSEKASQSHADARMADLAEPAVTPTENLTEPVDSKPETPVASKGASPPEVALAQEKESALEKEGLKQSQAATEEKSASAVVEPLGAGVETREASNEEIRRGIREASPAKREQKKPVEVVHFPIHQLVGSFNDWTINSNHEQTCGTWVTVRPSSPKIGRGLHREEFQILANGSWDKRLFPSGGTNETVVVLTPGKTCKAAECTPKASGHGRNWAIDGKPGSSFRVTFDPETLDISCEQR
eukprot:TRINITY_DN5933_c0_g1_i3.p1 TRINITY_DN5933_c0_g1~~TRINITY_DN5933_c0_g1_i3.p1  ORF type:complete len:570 (+),score=94.34 TRINITY_DN5933_c0_g1_i3:53-1762(+)